MTSTPKKRGRPQLPFRKPDGSGYVEGLRQRPDGRWVVIETGRMFREPDWRLAVQRFRQYEATKTGINAHVPLLKDPLGVVVAGGDFGDVDGAVKAALLAELWTG